MKREGYSDEKDNNDEKKIDDETDEKDENNIDDEKDEKDKKKKSKS